MSPCVQPWPPGAHQAARFLARPFASAAADLDFNLQSSAAPVAITQLLRGCITYPDGCAPTAQTLWGWTVPERRQGLLAIVHATGGDTVTTVTSCSDPACRNQIELDIALTGFAGATAESVEVHIPGHRVRCRVPTGEDVLAWANQGGYEPAWLAQRLVATVDDVPNPFDWVLPQEWLEPISDALQAADPLTALVLDVSCPCCGGKLEVQLDLEQVLLGVLRDNLRATLDEVHRLASAYHWSEAQIVAMPRWRRSSYLARLESQFQ